MKCNSTRIDFLFCAGPVENMSVIRMTRGQEWFFTLEFYFLYFVLHVLPWGGKTLVVVQIFEGPLLGTWAWNVMSGFLRASGVCSSEWENVTWWHTSCEQVVCVRNKLLLVAACHNAGTLLNWPCHLHQTHLHTQNNCLYNGWKLLCL